MKPCRECAHNISEHAVFCPGCGAPYPARDKWDGVGFEYKSEATLLGVPVLHATRSSLTCDERLNDDNSSPARSDLLLSRNTLAAVRRVATPEKVAYQNCSVRGLS
jgi:hypothetical protein